jgi:hypothetical protein
VPRLTVLNINQFPTPPFFVLVPQTPVYGPSLRLGRIARLSAIRLPVGPPPPLVRWFGKENTMPTPTDRKDEPIHYDADKARGAEIILTKRRNRVIFMGGLVGFVVLALISNWFA